MNKNGIFDVLQACLLALDGGFKGDYPEFNNNSWEMGEKLSKYLINLEVTI